MSAIKSILPSELWDMIVSPYKTDWRGIIFHHSAMIDDYDQGEAIEKLHSEGGRVGYPAFQFGMGYHILVNRSGRVQIGQRWPRQIHGAHCIGKNKTHIGVCLAGNMEVYPPTAIQINSLVWVVYYLGIKELHIHKEFANTLCPGKLFPFDDIKNRLILLKQELRLSADNIAVHRSPYYRKKGESQC